MEFLTMVQVVFWLAETVLKGTVVVSLSAALFAAAYWLVRNA